MVVYTRWLEVKSLFVLISIKTPIAPGCPMDPMVLEYAQQHVPEQNQLPSGYLT